MQEKVGFGTDLRHLLGLCSSWLWRHLANPGRVTSVTPHCHSWSCVSGALTSSVQRIGILSGNWKNSEQHKETCDFWSALPVEARCSGVVIPRAPLLALPQAVPAAVGQCLVLVAHSCLWLGTLAGLGWAGLAHCCGLPLTAQHPQQELCAMSCALTCPVAGCAAWCCDVQEVTANNSHWLIENWTP